MKVYLCDGAEPVAIVGSATLTRGAFDYHLELAVVLDGVRSHDPEVAPIVDWVEGVAAGRPITRRDLSLPVRVRRTIRSALSKGRLLPATHVVARSKPMCLVVVAIFALRWLV